MISKESKDLANKLTNLVNSTSLNYSEIGEALLCEHNTLQQSFMRVALSFIKARANEPRFVDDRNKATYELCKRLDEVLKEEPYYLPYI